MDKTISNIDEYIQSFDALTQEYLKQLRQCILDIAPSETTETISYKMPTFRYNGNLIHFAAFKKHIGIYPGPKVIEAFSEQISSYKTSKGAIQLPLDKPLPISLVQDILRFNINKLKDKQGPNWHNHRDNWKDCVDLMEQIVQEIGLQKEFKWGTNIYTFQGKNVIAWGGFKHFFSLWFYNGVFLSDPEKKLISASKGKTKALRQWRFTDVSEMDKSKIRSYILESIQTIKDGKTIKIEKNITVEPIGLLKEILKSDNSLEQAFSALSPGKRKEYAEYIEEAKQDKTKQNRIEKII